MLWRVEIKDKPGVFDAIGAGLKNDILDLKIHSVKDASSAQVYSLEGEISESQIQKICLELLVDKTVQDFSYSSPALNPRQNTQTKNIIEIAYNPGVMDPVEQSCLKAIKDLGIYSVTSVATAKKYTIVGKVTHHELNTIIDKLLCNKIIQHVVAQKTEDRRQKTDLDYQFNLIEVDLLNANDKKLLEISKLGQLFLNLKEMQAIKNYFKKIKRNPTDCELETLAQTWSEHCGHKTFRGKIEYKEQIRPAFAKASAGRPPKRSEGGRNHQFKTKKINNLLKSTIVKVTNELKKPWCVSVFHDNSGVIKFNEKYNVCFKVETHNHPSALEPFGGANTGIGGVIRDPLGTGLGAKPILNTDVFCFGTPDFSFDKLPAGTLHPKRIMKGVVSGVCDYGNKMGIPTVNGAILFDDRFVGNPLVYCGTVGIMPKEKSFKLAKRGDLIVLVGGRTGRDGIHGATFSSGELTHESEKISSGAVQIGNPIQEKKMLDTILQARDRNLYDAITDCGGGGLSSAVGEMAKDLGCRVNLEDIPLKYQGLSYTEIWISESQERMILSVPKENIQELLSVFEAEDVEAVVIGEFTATKRLQLYYKNNLVNDLEMEFLHEGNPKIEKKAEFQLAYHREPKFESPRDLTHDLKQVLSHYNVCSKEWVIRQYDHEVQGGTILKPLTGICNDGPSDAAVFKPLLDSKKGVIVSNGINFRYGMIDPYWMAASCIDEALRQIIAVGGSLKEVAILDNFCWGNPDKPDRLGSLVRCAEGCYEIAKEFGVPFISGKDSLYNEYNVKGESISIPGTILISAISVMDDISTAVSMDLKQAENLIYVVGQTFDEVGGSVYLEKKGFLANSVPKVNCQKALKIFNSLSQATSKGLIKSCHDCSEGGIGVAAAEMSFAGGLGMELFLSEVPYKSQIPNNKRNDTILFSESNSRFIVEIEKKNQKQFENIMKGCAIGLIGCVTDTKKFKVYGINSRCCLQANIYELKEAWQAPLRF